MAFKDLFGDLPLHLPYRGRVYTVEPIDAELGPKVQALFDVMMKAQAGSTEAPSEEDVELLSDLGEQQMYPRILGDAFKLMTDDLVPWAVIKRAALAAMFDACISREAAEAAWNGEGKAPNRASRRAAKSPASSARVSKAPPVSTVGTNRSPRKTASNGRSSSTTGTT